MNKIEIIKGGIAKSIISCLLIALFFCGCQKEDGKLVSTNGNVYTNNDQLSSAMVVPQINGNFSASISGWYDEELNNYSCKFSWANLWTSAAPDTLVSINFYGGASATNIGTIKRNIPFLSTNATLNYNISLSGNQAINPADRSDFYAGNWYCVLVTKRYPNGIVRGKLNMSKR